MQLLSIGAVQAELPVWVTVAGNPQTFAEAGRAGCHVLTHLLGQSVQELAEKVAVYRAAWDAAGHPGRGQVALMLHTFVGEDEDAVRAFAVLLMLTAGLSIFVALLTALKEREGDMAMLRVIGASRAAIIGQVASEGLILASAGAALGMLLGHGVIGMAAANIEQLRALEMGMLIRADAIDDFPKGVDSPADLEAARKVLTGRA